MTASTNTLTTPTATATYEASPTTMPAIAVTPNVNVPKNAEIDLLPTVLGGVVLVVSLFGLWRWRAIIYGLLGITYAPRHRLAKKGKDK